MSPRSLLALADGASNFNHLRSYRLYGERPGIGTFYTRFGGDSLF
jgi:hypothetical protein